MSPSPLLWPEFAACGKEAGHARMVLAHRAGLPAIRRALAPDAMYDWQLMTEALAAERPWWEPGSAHGYHVNTFGFLVGEIVRRASGMPAGRFFQREVARPAGRGLPVRRAGGASTAGRRVHVPADARAGPGGAADDERQRLPEPARASPVTGPSTRPAGGRPKSRPRTGTRTRGPSRGSTARSPAAESPAACACWPVRRVALASSRGLQRPRPRARPPSRFGLGFQLTQPERPLGPNPGAFGHFGAGGSVGFADPEAGLAFAYTPNQGLGPRWQNPRNRALIDAALRVAVKAGVLSSRWRG